MISLIEERSQYFQGPLMILWGHDFAFDNANLMFDNMDLMLNEINKNPEKYGVRFIYIQRSNHS